MSALHTQSLFSFGNQACWVRLPQGSLYQLDDCAHCVCVCLSHCVIHLNIYLWAIIYAASLDLSYSVLAVRLRLRVGKKKKKPCVAPVVLAGDHYCCRKLIYHPAETVILKHCRTLIQKKGAQIHKSANKSVLTYMCVRVCVHNSILPGFCAASGVGVRGE